MTTELPIKQEKGTKKEKILFKVYEGEGVFYRVRINTLNKKSDVVESEVIPCFTYINALFTYQDCNIN